MTISNTVRSAGPYTGNGVTTVFPFGFKVFLASEIVAVRSDGTTQTTLVQSTDYTVSLNPDQDSTPGGTITTIGTPLSSSFTLTITSNVSELQGASLQNQGGFYPKVIEAALDRAVILIQQLRSIANRTLRFPISDTGTNTELPTKNARANNLLGFDANGNPVAVVPASQSATALQISLAQSSGSSMVGFTQSLSGAVARTVQSKLRDTVSLKDFLPVGYVTDGSIDYVTYIQNAIDAVYGLGGGIIDCTGGRWLIDSADLVVKQGVVLKGPWKNLGETDGTTWTNIKSAFILNSSYTIRLAQEFSGIEGMGIFRKGLTKPTSLAEATVEVANFAGKAITVGYGVSKDASDTYVGFCLVLGFQYAYYNDFNERPRVEYLSGDCTNGVYLNQIYDVNHLFGCHFWPYVTTHNAWTFTGDAGWRRQGTAFYFGTAVDWGQATNCFSYGYDKGFDVNGSDNVVLLNCGTDGYKNNNTYSIGYHARGTTKNLNLVSCKSAAKNTSVLIELAGGGNSQCVKITGGNLWACSTSTGVHVYLKTGQAIVAGGVSMFDGPTGIKTDSTADSLSVTNCIFQEITNPYTLATDNNVEIRGNLFKSSTDISIGRRYSSDNQHANEYDFIYNAVTTGVQKYYRKARGTAASPSITLANDAPYSLYAQGWDGTGWQAMSQIRSQVQGTPSAGVMPGMFIFSTNPSGGLVDRIAMHNTGYLYPLTDNAYQFGSSSNRWSAIWAANGTIQTSDINAKQDITDSVLGLDFINTLRPVSYRWKEGGKVIERQIYRDAEGNECDCNKEGAIAAEIVTTQRVGDRTHWGFIAQEVKSAADAADVDFGGWVLSDKNDPDSQQALRYDQFISPLVKAVQELSAKVAELESKIK